MRLILISLASLLFALAILIYFDAGTLFLSALLLAIIGIKTLNRGDYLDKVSGIWFALSVAPAMGVTLGEVIDFNNGFLIQSVLSLLFFIYFYKTKPSIIKRLYESTKTGIIASSTIAGFASGILSAALWQAYLQLIL